MALNKLQWGKKFGGCVPKTFTRTIVVVLSLSMSHFLSFDFVSCEVRFHFIVQYFAIFRSTPALMSLLTFAFVSTQSKELQ